ncbi:MAG: sensor histidine kinase, partial [Gaiellaceae bacterium]
GSGYDPQRSDRTGWPKLGIQTMRERALAIGGSCEIVSSPGSGTRVSVHAPLVNELEAAGASAAR